MNNFIDTRKTAKQVHRGDPNGEDKGKDLAKSIATMLKSKDVQEKKSKQADMSNHSFIFSKGVFSENLIFYKFNSDQDFEINYKNTLFRIIPVAEYDSKAKFEKNVKQLKKEETSAENVYIDKQTDIYMKYKQEILSNHEHFTNLIGKKMLINFDDNVQLLHMQTGKFLKYKKNRYNLKHFLVLSSQPCSHTIFRIKPGFMYQTESSTNIYYNLSINLACGDKKSNREIYIANNAYKLNQQYLNLLENFEYKDREIIETYNREKSFRDSRVHGFSRTEVIVNETEESNEITFLKTFSKKESKKMKTKSKMFKVPEVICDDASYNRWKFLKFSEDFEDDDGSLNNFDLFWIQNCEKEVYVVVKEDIKTVDSAKTTMDTYWMINKNQEMSTTKNTGNASKVADREERFPTLPKRDKHHEENRKAFYGISSIAYDYLNYYNREKLTLSINGIESNEHHNPFGIFCFEPVYKDGNNKSSYVINVPPDIGPYSYKTLYKIRNIFSNTLICVDTTDPNEPFLKLISFNEIKNMDDCLFMIEHVYDKKILENVSDFNYIKKNDYIRIRFKKLNTYLALKSEVINRENKLKLILTTNHSDMTIFKLGCLTLDDKLLVNTFDQVNCVLDFLHEYYLRTKIHNEKKTNFIDLGIDEDMEEEILQYSKMYEILKKIKDILFKYKSNKTSTFDETVKLDVIKNIKEFKIIAKIMKILLIIWFKINIDDEDSREASSEHIAEFKSILANDINRKLNLKIHCTTLMLKIFKISYELDPTVLISIQSSLHHLFKFIGKIHYCTKFLIHILRNNNSLLLKLLTKLKDSKIDSVGEIRQTLKNLLQDESESSSQHDSITLFYELLNIMSICNDEPFKPFYTEIAQQLEIVVPDSYLLKPNNNIWILVEFELCDERIFFYKKFPNSKMPKKYEINFSNYDPIDTGMDKNYLQKIVAQNIIFYSNLSLHDKRLKQYLIEVFNFQVVNYYLNKGDEIGLTISDEIKCALIRIINYLHLKTRDTYILSVNLCRKVSDYDESMKNEFKYDSLSLENVVDIEVVKIIRTIEDKLRAHITEKKILSANFLLQLIETCQYIIRHIYIKHLEKKIPLKLKDSTICKFVSLMIIILENLLGISHHKSVRPDNSSNNSRKEVENRDTEKLIQILQGDKLGVDANPLQSPYLKLFEGLKKDYLTTVSKIEREKRRKSFLKKVGSYNAFDIETIPLESEITTQNITPEKQASESNKEAKAEMIRRICDIFLEFLNYAEDQYVTVILKNIIEIKNDEEMVDILNSSHEKEKNELINNKVFKFVGKGEVDYMTILDDFSAYYIELKAELGMTNYGERVKKNVKRSKYDNPIYNIYFECMQRLESFDMKIVIFEILYRINSQKMKFFDNISNLVILSHPKDTEKYDQMLKSTERLFANFRNFATTSITDDAIKTIIISFKNELKKLGLIFYDKSYFKNDYEELVNFKDKFFEKKKQEQIDNYLGNIIEKLDIETPQDNIFFDTDVRFLQYILKNLDIHTVCIHFMTKANEFILKSIVDNDNRNLNEVINEIQEVLEDAYIILTLFIRHNKKHKFILELSLETILFPITIAANLSIKLKLSISNFILEFLKNLKISELNYSETFIEMMHTLIKETNGKEDAQLIPYWVESLKIILKSNCLENDEKLITCLDIIKKSLINSLVANNFTQSTYMSLKEILQLMIYLKSIILDEYDTKIKHRFPLSEIMVILDILKNNSNDQFQLEIINLAIDYLFINRDIYKQELANNKQYLRRLEIILNHICKRLTNEMNESTAIFIKGENLNEYVLHLNIFVGISIPKIHIIITEISLIENIRNTIKETQENLILVSQSLYNNLFNIIKNIEDDSGKVSMLRDRCFMYYMKNDDFKIIEERISSLFPSSSDGNYYPIKGLYATEGEEDVNETHLMFNKSKSYSVHRFIIGDQTHYAFWNEIRELLNQPSNKINSEETEDDKTSFNKYINELINSERKDFIRNLVNFIIKINELTRQGLHASKLDFTFLNVFTNIFSYYVDNNQNFKEQLYFYFWILIYFMEYDIQNCEFKGIPLQQNKQIISELRFTHLISKIIKKKNLGCIDYSVALITKFFNTYLKGLDDNNKLKFYDFLINSTESENIFILMKNILENFKSKLTIDTKTVSIFITKYENFLNPYEETVQFISSLVENNSVAKHQMKDYLRAQNNKSKSHNFISLLADILKSFIPSNEKDKSFEKRELLKNYYSTIIKSIECLTKCSQGPCQDNQNVLIGETKILNFIDFYLFNVSYNGELYSTRARKTDTFDKVFDCPSLSLTKKKLSLLKYKLLLLFLSLTEGRKKTDRIYSKITHHINWHYFEHLMIETLREIMIEGNVISLQQLVMQDDFYLRYERQKKLKENENFAIFEIGTFVYIILNIYFENLHETLKDDNFIITIREIKRKMTSNRRIVEKKHVLSNTVQFACKIGKLMVRIFKGLIMLGWCRKNKDNEQKDENKINLDFYSAYEFYFKYTPYIEIIFCGQINPFYVKLKPMCQYLNTEMKDEFQENVPRDSIKSKLNYLFKSVHYYQTALSYTKSLEEFYKKVLIMDIILNQYLFWKDLSFLITLGINFLIVSSYYKIPNTDKLPNSDVLGIVNKVFYEGHVAPIYDYAFRYDHRNTVVTKSLLYSLCLIQMILAFLIFSNYFVKYLPKYTWADRNIKQTNCKRLVIFVYRMLMDFNFVYHLTYLLMAFLGFFLGNYLFFSFHLLEIVRRSTTLKNVLKAIWNPKKQIIVTLFLFIMFEYFFTIFIYLYLFDNVPNDLCLSMDKCLFTIFDQTFKNSNGIINYLLRDKYLSDFYFGKRFFMDNMFSIVLIMLILQMLAGIIIDNFSALREHQQMINEDKNNICFICDLHKNELNKLYGNEEGYQEHIKIDHYYWNFMFYLMNLIEKSPNELSGIDAYIFENYKNQNHQWIAFKT
jgi:hypothetical protein